MPVLRVRYFASLVSRAEISESMSLRTFAMAVCSSLVKVSQVIVTQLFLEELDYFRLYFSFGNVDMVGRHCRSFGGLCINITLSFSQRLHLFFINYPKTFFSFH